MSEHGEIILRPDNDNDPPDILGELVKLINELVPVAGKAGGTWLSGKAAQETAKAAEIRAGAIKVIGELQIERERLIQEREAIKKKYIAEGAQGRKSHIEKMYELETHRIEAEAVAQAKRAEALKNVVQALQALRDMGVELTLEYVQQALLLKGK